MKKVDIFLGNLKFVFYGNVDQEYLNKYLLVPISNIHSSDTDLTYQIKVAGKMLLPRNYSIEYSVDNFLGAHYDYAQISGKRLLISDKNKYGSHAFIINNVNDFEVYYLDDNSPCDMEWSVRLCRELLLLYYLSIGYIPLHASAVKLNNKVIVAFGKRFSGKTTTLCSFVKLGAALVSNDLVMVGINKRGQYEAIGWPWKISIGNGLANKMNLPTDRDNEKVELLPKDFIDMFKCKMFWMGEIGMLLMPHVELNNSIKIEKISTKETKRLLLEEGIEYPEIINIFTGEKVNINFASVIDGISKAIICYSLHGDIWNDLYKLNVN